MEIKRFSLIFVVFFFIAHGNDSCYSPLLYLDGVTELNDPSFPNNLFLAAGSPSGSLLFGKCFGEDKTTFKTLVRIMSSPGTATAMQSNRWPKATLLSYPEWNDITHDCNKIVQIAMTMMNDLVLKIIAAGCHIDYVHKTCFC